MNEEHPDELVAGTLPSRWCSLCETYRLFDVEKAEMCLTCGRKRKDEFKPVIDDGDESKDHAWVCGKLDYLANAISDVRDDLLEVVKLPADRAHLTAHGRRVEKVQNRLANLSELAEEIYNAVLKHGNEED